MYGFHASDINAGSYALLVLDKAVCSLQQLHLAQGLL
jgi:hypothetical protein